MKRKIIQTIIVVFFVAFAGYKAYSSLSPKAKLSDLVLENIEALAYNENNHGEWTCFYFYYDDLSNNNYVIITGCDDCWSHSATAASGPGTCRW